jgi:hypothetical protein
LLLNWSVSGVDPGVDPTQTPGEQLGAAESSAMLLTPPVAHADRAEPSTMIAQMPIATGTFVMIFGFSSSAPRPGQSPFDEDFPLPFAQLPGLPLPGGRTRQ